MLFEALVKLDTPFGGSFHQMNPPARRFRLQAQRATALSRAYVAAGDTARAIAELEWVEATAAQSLDPHTLFRTMTALASLYESTAARSTSPRERIKAALRLYRRVAAQYEGADPGFKTREIALAGSERCERLLRM